MNNNFFKLYGLPALIAVITLTFYWILIPARVAGPTPQDQTIADLQRRVETLEYKQSDLTRQWLREDALTQSQLNNLQSQVNHQNRMLLNLAIKQQDSE